ncbi:MAG TPA: PAS domain S-box protein [Candidatus Omnitrophota bacterium]|nr:PAS domain S-box protein [Candidatus Omnitrophota bacterium]
MKTKIISVFLIEDNPAESRLVAEMLQQSQTQHFELIRFENLFPALEQVSKLKPDVILLDLGLGDSQGIETLRKAVKKIPHIPIVVLTMLIDEAISLQALQEGAQDYLIKAQLSAPLLMRSLMYAIERKQTEIRLKDSEERFKNLVERLSDALFLYDEKGRIVQINHEACLSLGYSRDELLSLTIDKIETYYDYTNLPPLWDIVALKPMTVPGIHRRKDGSLFPVELKICRFMYQDQKLILLQARDVSTRKKVEQALLESESKFRSLSELSANLIFIIRDGQVVYVNKQCEEKMGYTKEEFLSSSFDFFSIVAPESVKLLKENYEKHLQGKTTASVEYVFLNKAGQRVNVILSTRLMQYDGAQAICGVMTDITERKQIEDALKKSEFKLRALIENDPEAIFLRDRKGFYVLLNKRAQELLVAATVSGKIPQELSQGLSKVDRKIMRLRKCMVIQEMFSQYGEESFFEVSKYPVFDDEGKIIFLCSICRDITEKIKLEKVKDALIRDVSHELKTPIAMMQMAYDMAERAIKQGSMERIKQSQLIASRNLERMHHNVNNILDMFVLMGKRHVKPHTSSSIKKVARKVFTTLGYLIEKKKLKTKIDIPRSVDKVPLNEKDLHTIMYNTIDNALKFTEQGGIYVTARLKREHVCLKIRDTGFGIPSQDVNKVFDRFYKRNAALAGTGLGLSICKEIVTAYQGSIKITSAGEGKGTVVSVSLPKMDKR